MEVAILRCKVCELLCRGGEKRVAPIYEQSVNLSQSISKINDGYPSSYTFDEVDWLGEPDGKNLLEVGCSAGYFLLRAREKGWNTYGVDIDETAVEFARKNYNLNVTCEYLSELSYPAHFFSSIVMIGVLEHIPEPADFLEMLKGFLKPDGAIVLAVPNASSLNARVSKFSQHDWDMFCEPGHLHHFNIKTISLLAKRCDLEIVDWRTTTIKIRGKIPWLPVRITKIEHVIHSLYQRYTWLRIMYESTLRLLDWAKLGDILVAKLVKQ